MTFVKHQRRMLKRRYKWSTRAALWIPINVKSPHPSVDLSHAGPMYSPGWSGRGKLPNCIKAARDRKSEANALHSERVKKGHQTVNVSIYICV